MSHDFMSIFQGVLIGKPEGKRPLGKTKAQMG
jgi:hypothetical protein